jgi:hypothetical protein
MYMEGIKDESFYGNSLLAAHRRSKAGKGGETLSTIRIDRDRRHGIQCHHHLLGHLSGFRFSVISCRISSSAALRISISRNPEAHSAEVGYRAICSGSLIGRSLPQVQHFRLYSECPCSCCFHYGRFTILSIPAD